MRDSLRRALLLVCGLVGIAFLNPARAASSNVPLSCQSNIYWDPPDMPVEEHEYAYQFDCSEPLTGTACYYASGAPSEYQWWMFDCTTLENTGACDSSGCRVT
jgi:hypothetical protein